jgi:hypothetical protein
VIVPLSVGAINQGAFGKGYGTNQHPTQVQTQLHADDRLIEFNDVQVLPEQSNMSEKYIVITEISGNTSEELHAHSSTYPVLVAIGVDSGRILIQQGNGHGFNGAVISIARFSSKKWKEKFKAWECLWFLDFISDEVEGSLVELIDKIRERLMIDTNTIKTVIK